MDNTKRFKLKMKDDVIPGRTYTCYDGISGDNLSLEFLGYKDGVYKFLDKTELEVVHVKLEDIYDTEVCIEYTISNGKITICKDSLFEDVDKKLLSVAIEDVVRNMYENAKQSFINKSNETKS